MTDKLHITNMTNRLQITPEQVDKALATLRLEIFKRLEQKGWGSFASSHEILGILEEEFDEFKDAVRANNGNSIRTELLDIAVGSVFGVACVDADGLDWL